MSDLTKEQEEFFEKEEKRLEDFFETPMYESFKIQYVKDTQNADIYISRSHDILDYLAIGFVCLCKQMEGDSERVVYVGHKHYDSIKKTRLMDQLFPLKAGAKRVPTTPLFDLIEQIADIAERYYKNPNVCTKMTGLTFAPYVTSVAMGYCEKHDIILEFNDFKDTVYAQQIAFYNLKKHIIASNLGALYAMIYGD